MFTLKEQTKDDGVDQEKVLGQDGQQVLVKYGSNYVRVHPCRLALEQQEW